jgi:CheY-like chemotaxis protein
VAQISEGVGLHGAGAKHRGDIAVLLTDIRLPGINGMTLKGAPRSESAADGATGKRICKLRFPDENTVLMRKPFTTPDALAQKLRALLDRV